LAVYNIGLDCTDSARLGMCTTYLGARVLEELGLAQLSYPELVRLNPNVPWKTRGNGAVSLRLTGPEGLSNDILERVSKLVEELSVFEDPQTNPGLFVLEGEVPHALKDWYYRALHRILTLEEARKLALSTEGRYRMWKNGRGLIGAMAAVGFDHAEGSTYEMILYRPADSRGERKVDLPSLSEADRKSGSTFFNFDEFGRPLCIPRSPCPVLLGIRGTDPVDVYGAASSVEAEDIERWVLWRTNQHTDAHIEIVDSLGDLLPYSSIKAEVIVRTLPEYRRGGHLFFEVEDKTGGAAVCAAFEPTKVFRKDVSRLLPGDRINIWGGVKPGKGTDLPFVNLEKIEVLEMGRIYRKENPMCGECGGRMESMGRGQGYRCKRCGLRDDDRKPVMIEIKRDIGKGMIEPPMGAWRHLFKPGFLVIDPLRTSGDPILPAFGRGRPECIERGSELNERV